MSQVVEQCEAALIFPDASVHLVTGGALSHRLNAGWTWRAQLATALNIDSFTQDDAFRLRLVTNRGTFISPPLSMSIPQVITGMTRVTNISGIDHTSWLLGLKGITQESFVAPLASDVLARISLLTGVAITGAPTTRIPEFDIQLAPMGQQVTQLLRELGFNYKIGPNGEVVCLPWGTKVVTNRPTLRTSQTAGIAQPSGNITRTRNLAQDITFLRLRKLSKFASSQTFEFTQTGAGAGFPDAPGPPQTITLQNPLEAASILPTAGQENGRIGFVSLFDTDGKLCRFFSFNPAFPAQTPTSGAPAVSGTVGVIPPGTPNTLPIFVTLRLDGTPPGSAGFDNAFEVNFPSALPDFNPGNLPSIRTRVEVIESPTWPTKAFVLGLAAAMWQEAQRDFETLEAEIVIDPGFDVTEEIPATADTPAGICTEWSIEFGEEAHHIVRGYVPKTLPVGSAAVVVKG